MSVSQQMRPEADEYVGKYVRVLHDFDSTLQGELRLSKGDVLKVTSYVDKNWLKGKSGDREGSFPKDFVEKIHLPHINPNQKLFAATEKFPAQQNGDLGLQKGDIVVGLRPVDEFWWEGECKTVNGIFPITHVMEIEIPTLLRQRSRSVHSSEPLFAQALVDAVAQLDDELSFQAGDIIKVTEVIDEDWYRGECHGKTGMFLTSCVQLLNENECIESGQPSDNSYVSHHSSPQTTTRQFNQTHEPSHEEGTSHSQQPSVDTLSKEKIGSDNVSSSIVERGFSYSDNDAGVTPYARALYQFIGENPDELSFEPNDIVTLIQHVDEQWIEGEIDGNIGLFPASFVEIVVDCPYAFNTGQSLDLPVDLSMMDQKTLKENNGIDVDIELPAVEIKTENENVTEETFALVLYSFTPETPQDLSVNEGETVTVIRKIDDNWILARNETGQEGMCPMSFVEVIGVIPEFPHVSCDKNDNEIKSKLVLNNDKSHDASYKETELNTGVNGSSDLGKSIPDKLADKNSTCSTPSPGTVIGKQIRKPGLKPKPLLAPKPVIKPKPLLSPKPFVNMDKNFKSVTFESSTMPKSASSKSLSTVGQTLQHSITMTKSQSMTDIDKSKSNLADNSELETSDDTSGSTNSLESDKRNSGGQKTFEDWDMTKPLDSLIKTEFVRAKQEAESRSRGNSTLSSGSIVDTATKSQEQSVDQTDRLTRPRFSYQANYSRENFEAMEKDAFSVGNSVFFVNDFKPNERKLRKPPLAQNLSHDFNRRPSLKRAAPPRPVGPRINPQPPRTHMVPSRLEQPPSQGSEINHTKGIPSRPQSGPRRHTRPAPPRPEGLSKKGSPPRPPNNNNLIRFSPPESIQDIEEPEVEDDNETVQDLKSRIARLEKDLEGFKRNKEELELKCQNVEEKDAEIHENISFYEDNIQGITAEINLLKENLAEISPREKTRMAQEKAAILQKIEEEKFREAQRKKMEEEREERREKRIKVIDELIQTEKDFITSLNLTMVTFLGPDVEKHPDVDFKQLFGNIDEVADVSQRLLTKLEEATNNKDFSEQIIGTCFIGLAEDMKDVYAPYCRNHDDVINLTEKYKQNADINGYLESLLDKLREQLTVFDLEALLIKPVQRVLKYPLLLNALLKATEEDHMDRKEVLNAINCMTDVATAINEYKRRKDLVFKYKKKETEALGEKLSKLSLHSIRKKSSRIRGRFSANLGFSDVTRDPVFEKEETSYRYLEKTVKVFVKDVQMYIQEAQEVVNVMENIAADIEDYYGEKRDMDEVRKYQAFQNQVQMTFFPNFRMEVDDLVLLPLGQLSQMFEGPNKVIQKRYDKLLDYDNMKRKAQNDRVSEKALQTAKQDYEALNAQLLDELPNLYTLASQLFQDCVGSFVRAQREYQNCILHETYKLTDLQFLEDENILETFNIQHMAVVDKLAALSFMPRTFSPRVADLKQDKKNKRMSLDPSLLRSTELVPQIDSQRVLLIQQYPKDKLYRVTGNFVATDPVDLSVCEGDVVGVIMEKDQVGNKDRWFVDNGAKKGFVARQVLTVYDTSPPRHVSMPDQMLQGVSVSPGLSAGRTDISTPDNTTLDSLQDEDSMDIALEEDMTPEVPPSFDDDLQLYYAEYPFTARNENEVSLFEHQVVNVLAKHDQEGNEEWWYVEADGRYGYTPAIYLREMDSCEDPT